MTRFQPYTRTVPYIQLYNMRKKLWVADKKITDEKFKLSLAAPL